MSGKPRKKSTRSLAIAVLMDPLETVIPHMDTSLVLMEEAHRRGHRTFFVLPSDIRWQAGGLTARAIELHAQRPIPHFTEIARHELDMRSMDVVLIRKNPPFDSGYLYMTQLLDLIADKVLIINAPAGLRNANEKLFIMNFPDLIPPTLVSCRIDDILAFQRQYRRKPYAGRLVIKPLHLFGGEGIMSVDEADIAGGRFQQVVQQLTDSGRLPVMVQPYLRIERGDKRVMVIDGKPCGTLLRIPKTGEFKSNLASGGTAVRTEITTHDRDICAILAPVLRRQGLYLAGLDVIDGYLTEINVTSPTGFQMIEKLSGVVLQSILFDFIERRLR